MSNRSERREAERLARKLAYKNRSQPEPETEQPTTISEAQLRANRANAQFSAGATSPEGKAKSAMNSLKHGLTSKTVLLPNEDPADYQELTNIYLEMHSPANDEESRLVQSLIDTKWRLNRITLLESALLHKGQIECTKQNEDRQGMEREHFILADAYLKYEKSLRNLQIQETRLRRLMEKEKVELQRLQAIRKRDELKAIEAQLKAAKSAKANPTQPPQNAQPTPNGFVFETASSTQTDKEKMEQARA